MKGTNNPKAAIKKYLYFFLPKSFLAPNVCMKSNTLKIGLNKPEAKEIFIRRSIQNGFVSISLG